ncbi:MAG: tRNA (adenosine(37)-N6)-dimethylallyltransferase MiaA, partial [Pseudomonadota bacterium]|nr:tRNA (adenosine(37)-N6)-dimethylallyltransferase MiaA [Pseudomonadota bacterium]
GAAEMHARLAAADPATAAGLRPSDGQRIARAWEVLRSTGRGLASWQQASGEKAPYEFHMILLDPARDELRVSLETRFGAMLAAGALDEVRSLLELGLDASLPALRAVGVPELAAVLRGESGLDQARERAVAASRRYVKRQITWFRNREILDPAMKSIFPLKFQDWKQLSESQIARIASFVSRAA